MRRSVRNEMLAGIAAGLTGFLVCACEPADARHAWTNLVRDVSAIGAAAAGPAHARAEAPQATAGVAQTDGAGAHATPTPSTPPASTLDLARARVALAAVPALAADAERFVPFTDADVGAALRRGDRSRESIQLWTMMPSLFAWNPVPGKTFWVLSGRVGARALLSVIEARADGAFAHASSTLIDEPTATLAIGSSSEYPKQLTWSTCYGCAGEGGTIRFADDGRVEFSYR